MISMGLAWVLQLEGDFTNMRYPNGMNRSGGNFRIHTVFRCIV
jgi:hypothetical protein